MSDAKPNGEQLKEQGNKAFADKNFTEAIRLYTQAIQIDPSNHVLFSNRSASYAGLGEWTQASDDAKECIRLDPTFLKGYFRLATAQMELNVYEQALATLRQGLSIDANHPQLLKLQRAVQQKINFQQQPPAADTAATSVTQQSHPQQPNVILDEATKQEFQDLQVQHASSLKEYDMVNANLIKTQREYRIFELTNSELAAVPADTKCYRSIGKMFLCSSKDRVTEHLEKQMEEMKRKDVDLTQKREYLERRIKSQRQNMEELVAPAAS